MPPSPAMSLLIALLSMHCGTVAIGTALQTQMQEGNTQMASSAMIEHGTLRGAAVASSTEEEQQQSWTNQMSSGETTNNVPVNEEENNDNGDIGQTDNVHQSQETVSSSSSTGGLQQPRAWTGTTTRRQLHNSSNEEDDWPAATAEDNARAIAAQLNVPRGGGYSSLIQPVAFHVIYMADGTGNVPYSALVAQIDQLNRAFGAVEANKAGYANPTDARIKFTLYSVDYTQNDDWHQNCALFNYQSIIKPYLAVNPAAAYNVYICYCAGSLGLSWLPYQVYRGPTDSTWKVPPENHYILGSILHYQLLPGNNIFNGEWGQGDILSHESGHNYGLKHIYEGGCVGTEALSDMIDDTPRQNGNTHGSCPSLVGLDTCPSLPGKDDNSNYMGITFDSCRSHFTPGQVDFMRNTITQYKPSLVRQIDPPCVAAISDTDNSADLRPCVGPVSSSGKGGGKWCPTDQADSSIWGWACCAQDGQSCRQGTFSLATTGKSTGPPPTASSPGPSPAPAPNSPPTSDPGGNGGALCGNWVVQGSSGQACQIPFKMRKGGKMVKYNAAITIGTNAPYQWTKRQGLDSSTVWCPYQGVSVYNPKSTTTRASWGVAVCK